MQEQQHNGNGAGNGASQNGTAVRDETFGVSQVGPFDYVPKLGFREYWYPGIWAKEVKKRPVHRKMLGDDLVFFRGGDGEVAVLSDWCPHRGARLSLGVCEFDGTITCPYHGYTFDSDGDCVAGLIDSPTTPMIGKLRARSYPTQEHMGIVYVWMGRTEPVPLEEDLPAELLDPRNKRFVRSRLWETNWTEPIAQGVDFHEAYLHRKQTTLWRALNKDLPLFRPKLAYYGGVNVVGEGPNYFVTAAKAPVMGQAFHPGIDDKWPKHTWWRVFKAKKRGMYINQAQTTLLTGKAFDHSVELPSKIRALPMPESVHLRWMVPIEYDYTRVWTYTMVRTPKTIFGRMYQRLWYYLWRKPSIIVETNEKEDLVVFKKERLRLDLPQKLGPLDAGLIYFRRHLALRARDYQRLGRAEGALKEPPESALQRSAERAESLAAAEGA